MLTDNGYLPEEYSLPLRNGDQVTNDFWSYNDCLDGSGQATQLKIHIESKTVMVFEIQPYS